MATKKNIKKNKLENLHLKERINYGYRKVIIMMLVSGLLSIVVIGILFFNMKRYVQNVTVADQAVKICRINVNAAARNIREMALNNDASSYDNYEQTVKKMLAEVDTQLNNLKKSGVVPDADYEEYSSALADWGNIGYSIMEKIKSGDKDKAVDSILNDCTPALNKAVEIAIRLDEITDEQSSRSVRVTVIFAVAGEELGFFGCCGIILLLFLILVECIRTSRKAKDLSGTLICCGMAGLIAFQSFLNISVATGILPNTGTPLPFVSYGLTSLVTLYIGMGLVLNVGLQNRDFVTRNYELLRRKTINEHRIDRA